MTERPDRQFAVNEKNEISGSSLTFVSISMVRALAIVAIIIENCFTLLPWKNGESTADLFATIVTSVTGTFVHLFFILSGFGLTFSCLRQSPVSWTAWARKRFTKIVVPFWAAVIVTFALANLAYIWATDGGQQPFSWMTLLAYLTFLRNVYSPGWKLNSTLWFMPVIIGLYALFPLLLHVLKRYGLTALMALSLVVGNGSVAVCVYLGYPVDHQGALPLYFVDEFALGMALAAVALRDPGQLNRFEGPGAFFAGMVFYAAGGLMARYEWLGAGFQHLQRHLHSRRPLSHAAACMPPRQPGRLAGAAETLRQCEPQCVSHVPDPRADHPLHPEALRGCILQDQRGSPADDSVGWPVCVSDIHPRRGRATGEKNPHRQPDLTDGTDCIGGIDLLLLTG